MKAHLIFLRLVNNHVFIGSPKFTAGMCTYTTLALSYARVGHLWSSQGAVCVLAGIRILSGKLLRGRSGLLLPHCQIILMKHCLSLVATLALTSLHASSPRVSNLSSCSFTQHACAVRTNCVPLDTASLLLSRLQFGVSCLCITECLHFRLNSCP